MNYAVGGNLTQVDHVTLKLDSDPEVTVALGVYTNFQMFRKVYTRSWGYLATEQRIHDGRD